MMNAAFANEGQDFAGTNVEASALQQKRSTGTLDWKGYNH